MSNSIGIKFPFGETFNGGVIKETTTTQDAVRTNLVSLLTCRKGQRVMRQDFYSPFYDALHEQYDSIVEEMLKTEVKNKINKYIPEVDVKNIILEFDGKNTIEAKIIYSITNLSETNEVLDFTFNNSTNE